MKFTISIVSHRSGHLIANLFGDMQRFIPEDDFEILLTINCPEDESFLKYADNLPLTVLRNARPLGFGANHNQAFAVARGSRFVVVNPDIRLMSTPWGMLDGAFEFGVGACAPLVLGPSGEVEDSVRRYPTVTRLLSRAVLGQRNADYVPNPGSGTVKIDWAAGMFVMFDSNAFRNVGGFDTRYHMYLEDVDICKRLNAAGWGVVWLPHCQVVHDAQRASRRDWMHRRWHLRSMFRFLANI